MPFEPPRPPNHPEDARLLGFRRDVARRPGLTLPHLERPPERRGFAANDEVAVPPGPGGKTAGPERLDLTAFRAEVAPLLEVLGYHLADPSVWGGPAVMAAPFVERRKAPRTIDRLNELEAQIARHGDPSGLRERLRRLLLAELELLGVVGRRREDRPLAEAATRALRG
jgi:hypothetical protein